MKICWDNLENLELRPNGFLRLKNTFFYFKEFDSCLSCGEPFLGRAYSKNVKFCSEECKLNYIHDQRRGDLTGQKFGKLTAIKIDPYKKSKQVYWLCNCECGGSVNVQAGKLKLGTAWHCGCDHGLRENLTGKKFNKLKVIDFVGSNKHGPMWLCKCDCGEEVEVLASNIKSGRTESCGCVRRPYGVSLVEEDLSSYDALKDSLGLYEKIDFEILSEFNNFKQLLVFCTYCGRSFKPTKSQISNRLSAIYGITTAENRFYCGDGCKTACPIFGRQKWPKGHKKATSREVQAELRQLVLQRDGWVCQYGNCSKTTDDDELHCHHFEGINLNPIESADMDMCITFCKEHHIKVHSQKDCRYFELTCDYYEKTKSRSV